MTLKLICFFTLLFSTLQAADIATNFLFMDENRLADIAIAKIRPRKLFGVVQTITFDEACTEIELKVYGTLFGKKNEKAAFEDMCILAKADHPVWQIYLASLFYDGREWAPANHDLSFLFFQSACNNTTLSNGIYELDEFASDLFTHLKRIYSLETVTLTQQLNELILLNR